MQRWGSLIQRMELQSTVIPAVSEMIEKAVMVMPALLRMPATVEVLGNQGTQGNREVPALRQDG